MVRDGTEPWGPDGYNKRLVKAFGRAQIVYDRLLGTHSVRVGDLAGLVAGELDLDKAERPLVAHAGAVHDLGKFGLSPAVLTKPGPLMSEEREEMQRHPVTGAEMLLAISEELAPLAEAVRSHHERWDGGGYPDGLAGEQIPRSGCLLAVVDVYDALTHARPYRSVIFSPARARAYLGDHAGTQFDPDCVAAAMQVLRARATGRHQFSIAQEHQDAPARKPARQPPTCQD